MLIDDVYRLQTRESAEWRANIGPGAGASPPTTPALPATARPPSRRPSARRSRGSPITQGVTRTARRFDPYFGADQPKADTGAIPVWIRDEWAVSERTAREDAQEAGPESPIVFVFLPRRDAESLKDALAAAAAATETVQTRARPATPEGENARAAMESRARTEAERVKSLVAGIVSQARVFQGGGNEVLEFPFAAAVRTAVEAALRASSRTSGSPTCPAGRRWRAGRRRGDDALTAVGYQGDVEKYPPAIRVRDFVGGGGKRGLEVRKQFTGAPFGWPQDAVDGLLLALLAGGFVRASRNGQPVPVKGLAQGQIGVPTSSARA